MLRSYITDDIKRTFATELEGFEMSKGTVRFPLDERLPVTLLKRLVKARLADVRRKAPVRKRAKQQ